MVALQCASWFPSAFMLDVLGDVYRNTLRIDTRDKRAGLQLVSAREQQGALSLGHLDRFMSVSRLADMQLWRAHSPFTDTTETEHEVEFVESVQSLWHGRMIISSEALRGRPSGRSKGQKTRIYITGNLGEMR
jgi:hypothetical protein